MCRFCEKIYDIEEGRRWARKSECEEDYYDPASIIVVDNSYELWSRCPDSFYNGFVMCVDYCPKCGTKLEKKF